MTVTAVRASFLPGLGIELDDGRRVLLGMRREETRTVVGWDGFRAVKARPNTDFWSGRGLHVHYRDGGVAALELSTPASLWHGGSDLLSHRFPDLPSLLGELVIEEPVTVSKPQLGLSFWSPDQARLGSVLVCATWRSGPRPRA